MNTPHTPPAVSESRPLLSLRGNLLEFWRDHPETGTPQPCLVATLAIRTLCGDREPFGPRLIACWNACRDMADPAAEIARLRAQRDELLKACKVMVEHASEKYPHFESERGQVDILQASIAIANATRQ